MKEPVWILDAAVRIMHERLIAEFGGSAGIRDAKLLESALNRPKHAFTYGDVDLFDLAAAYAFGLSKNHPFIDGNKRIALAVSRVFLLRNGFTITASQQEKYQAYYGLAAGSLSEKKLATWLRQNSHKC
jgi:death-on-curing protein